ncbi:MAG: uroporphyrinogen-III synthase [Alphaproteobacteria bacterium]|nr:uroporphyrinogen-III synthase [Alphaproteobacteria bacterium]
MARILITRPEPDAVPLAARLDALGHTSLAEPMLEIRFLDDAPFDPAGAQALLFTSANGVRAAAARDAGRALPAWCVGDATAQAARAAGFARVESAGGDVAALAALARRLGDPAKGPLLHVAGTVAAGDLAGLLETGGFTVRRAVLYEAKAASRLSPPAIEALRSGTIDAIALFSPRTARTFAKLVREEGLEADCGRIDMLCLSDAVSAALDDLPHKRMLTAAEPTQDALIELIS